MCRRRGLAWPLLGRLSAAEPLLRECLAIREKTQPDVWTTFNPGAPGLGGALLGQKKFADPGAPGDDGDTALY